MQRDEYEAALAQAYIEYEGETEAAEARARRRHISSRAVMVAFAIVAVLLTAGGIAGPQITYALEASRYSEIAGEANSHADKAEELESLLKAEQQLFVMRSNELRGTPSALLDLSEDESDALSLEFRKNAAATAKTLRDLRDDETPSSGDTVLQKKALEARDLEQPDPQTWFAVSSETFATYADIQPTPVKRADTGDTVTLDMVKTARELVKANAALVNNLQNQYDAALAKNEDLRTAVDTAAKLVRDESVRAAKAGSDLIADRENDDSITGRLPTEAEAASREALTKTSSALSAAASATVYAVDADDKVVAVAEGKPLPEGTVVIPGGSAVQLAYMLPKLEAYVTAFNAEQTAYNDEVARLAAEEAARIAAEEEAARQAEEELQRQLEEEQNNNEQPPPTETPDPTPPPTKKPDPEPVDCTDPANAELEECQPTLEPINGAVRQVNSNALGGFWGSAAYLARFTS